MIRKGTRVVVSGTGKYINRWNLENRHGKVDGVMDDSFRVLVDGSGNSEGFRVWLYKNEIEREDKK